MPDTLERLRQLYLADLTKVVKYGDWEPRSRVRHPGKWNKINALHHLNESHQIPLDVMTPKRDVWVWSDPHFFHRGIIEFSERPFPDLDTMHEHMVANFNEYVGPNDISIWVGDVGFGRSEEVNKLLDQCNGYKILVIGNHDFDGKKVRQLNFDETHLLYLIETDEVGLVFTHYPMDNIPDTYLNVHGHLHVYPNSNTGHPLHYNVNCEVHGFRPVNLTEIIRIAKIRLTSNENN